MPSTYQVLMRIAPKALPVYRRAFATKAKLLEDYGLTTPLRISHFLAQTATESGGFRHLRENMSYSKRRIIQIFGIGRHSAGVTSTEASSLARRPYDLAERVYGLGNPRKAKELGNTKPGDGYEYRGVGPLQNTGRRQFHILSKAATKIAGKKIDFIANPDLLTSQDWILLGALEYWRENNLNTMADRNDLRGITKAVNGGYNGFKERERYFKKAYGLFDTPEGEVWKHADEDRATLDLQIRLNSLGYKLKTDGLYGPATEAAVRDFQKKAGLKADGIAGDLTWAALEARLDVRTPSPPDKVSDGSLRATGAATAGAGAAGNTLIEVAKGASLTFAENQWLQIAFGIVMLIGVAFIVWPMIRSKK